MESSDKTLRVKFLILLLPVLIFITFISMKAPSVINGFTTISHKAVATCQATVSEESITPLKNTKHFLVSAYVDQRKTGHDIRIIGIFRRDSIQALHCLFCCGSHLSTTTAATTLQHSDNFGFAFVTTDVKCQIPSGCSATLVTLVTQPDGHLSPNLTFIPLKNRKTGEDRGPKFNFTVCISNLFGDYNNVLQFAQTLEMYRLLGVNRVVIYKTSCSPDLDHLLQVYSQDGFVEIVPWPIDKHLNPSRGWQFSQHGGDIHYFGQLTTLNECIYRSMERSHYVLLNDIDEIIMPYQHNTLMSLMSFLQPQHPDTGVFLIENHIFPKKHFEPSGRFHLPQWNEVPGVNILEHIYREEPSRKIYHPYKMLLQPKFIEQTSVHELLINDGPRYKVPPEVCRIIHVRVALQGSLKLEELHVDKRLWDFQEKLIPNVDRMLRRAGLLSSET
ncbi:uncharacterized protein LOC114456171 [Gouania willdenowi]|uniref:Glycosyltransferase family 92 protein n=1 Tax=Gouania willdenowi TaxID=441366 RepID=A0A8C5N5M3_GOUWI|nr:uncharacterized protein LOC114456171 [Gouania willdenowi]